MKVLIWLGCIMIYSVIQTAFKYAGITLGGIPTALLAFATVFVPAPFLCKKWTAHIDRKKTEEVSRRAEDIENTLPGEDHSKK